MKATPEMIAAAWSAWKRRHGEKLGPGPAFTEAIEAAFAVMPAHPPEGRKEAGEPAAWAYEMFREGFDPQTTPPNYAYWEKQASVKLPTWGEVRNAVPLYASPIPARDTARGATNNADMKGVE